MSSPRLWVTAVEAALVAVAAWPCARVLARPLTRRLAREVPTAAAALAIIAFAIGTAAVIWSPIRHGAVAAMVAAAVLARWRARPSFGRRQRLPPGSLGLAASLDAIDDPEFYRHGFSRWGPVFKMSQFHRPTVCVLGLERGHELLRRHRAELAPAPLPFTRLVPGGFLRYLPPERHDVLAPLFRTAFGTDVLGSASPRMTAAVRRNLDLLAAEGGTAPRPAVERLVHAALAAVVLGVEPHDEARLDDLTRALEPLGSEAGADRRSARRAAAALERVAKLLSDLPEVPPDGHPTSSVDTIRRSRPDALHDPWICGNLAFMLHVAGDNVSGLLVWLLKMAADHPSYADRLAALPPDAARELADRVVLETLRLAQSEYLYRIASRPLEIDGFTVPRGWFVRVCIRESHREPGVFDRPDTFDPDRFAGRRPTTAELAPFGLDRHACPGAQLTLGLARTFLLELAHRYRIRALADGPPERPPRHWHHWRPSAAFRVTLQPRSSPAPDGPLSW